ncbi:MAG: glycosyltransferase [Sphingobacteriaceae bacterium]|nr:glycosyltransferase [Sphingobacteriaceae bacterium]
MFTTKKKVIVSVINDLVTDNRVQKTCGVLAESGYEVLLVGRKLKNSLPVPNWNMQTKRMKLIFTKGPLFYLFFNIRLFFILLFTKADLLFANDLDTLWPNFIVSKIKSIPLVYDSHELFCEVPELKNSNLKRKIWQSLESNIVPKLKYCITVNQSIANIFNEKYKVHFFVIRNIPQKPNVNTKSKEQLNLPAQTKIILMQGAGINVERGAEELVEAMKEVNQALLLIIGGGDVWSKLAKLVEVHQLQDKVILIDKIPKEELISYTLVADLGISIDKNTNLNYYNSLPNKLFDYLQAGIPVLATHLPEIERILNQYNAGWFIENHLPSHIAERINYILGSEELAIKKTNALRAGMELNWETEKVKYLKLIEGIQF